MHLIEEYYTLDIKEFRLISKLLTYVEFLEE